MPPSPTSIFKAVERASGPYAHGNGAYGSFGFRRTGKLRDVYDGSKELQLQFPSYDKLWQHIKAGKFDDPSIKNIESIYANHLTKKFGNNLDKMAAYNWGNSSGQQTYVNKVRKAAGLKTAVVTPESTIVVGSQGNERFAPAINKSYQDPGVNITTSANRSLISLENYIPKTEREASNNMTKLSIPTFSGKSIQAPKTVQLPTTTQPVSTTSTSSTPDGYKPNPMMFASNIANALRKLPMPSLPVYTNPISLQRVSMDNDRYAIEQGVRGANNFAANNLDSQAAAAVMAHNNAARFNQYSKVNQDERNQNIGIANEEATRNQAVNLANQQATKGYQDSLVERKLAQQRLAQENLANVSDKIMQNQQDKLRYAYAKEAEDFEKRDDPYGIYKKRNGGIISNHSAGRIQRMNFRKVF